MAAQNLMQLLTWSCSLIYTTLSSVDNFSAQIFGTDHKLIAMARRLAASAFAVLSCTCQLTTAQGTQTKLAAYTVPPGFPTSLFPAYYIPSSPTNEPQPIIYDDVLNYTFPLELTNPATIPQESEDPIFFPQAIGSYTNGTAIIAQAQTELQQIFSGAGSNCTKCVAALKVGQYVAQRIPKQVPNLLIALCQQTKFMSNASCMIEYTAEDFGAIYTQVLALANIDEDGQAICNRVSSTFCPRPFTIASNTSAYFGPKPDNISIPDPSGQLVKVWHGSDFHLDPRFDVGAEVKCTDSLCCRPQSKSSSGNLTVSAPLYGAYSCDSPYYLVTSALEAIGPLTGTSHDNATADCQFAWSIYTGDLVSHDQQNELSRNYTMYAETSIYSMLKHYMPSGPIFTALGNHDTNPDAINSPHNLPGPLGLQQSWNYEHVSGLWQHNNWITPEAAKQARTHYGAYSITHPVYSKLRIITINTDFWYRNNYLNFINTTNPDNSGILMFLAQELAYAETHGERVWVMGHVLSGWDGSNPIPNPTDLFYQIVDRFSPHVIAGIFFGHTHEDELMIYYGNNATEQTAGTAQAVGWIGPSVTPLTNVNPSWRTYMVDTGDFQIYESYTYYTNLSSAPTTAAEVSASGPVWQFEYSARDTYAPYLNSSSPWPKEAPLNATFWHYVSEQLEKNVELASLQNTLQGRHSVKSPNCTNIECAQARACYMRSGNVALGRECIQGYGSVQSAFTPPKKS